MSKNTASRPATQSGPKSDAKAATKPAGGKAKAPTKPATETVQSDPKTKVRLTLEEFIDVYLDEQRNGGTWDSFSQRTGVAKLTLTVRLMNTKKILRERFGKTDKEIAEMLPPFTHRSGRNMVQNNAAFEKLINGWK